MTKKKEKEMTKAEAIDGLRRMGATVASYDHIYTDPITGIQTLVSAREA
jgi:hypothetical protein